METFACVRWTQSSVSLAHRAARVVCWLTAVAAASPAAAGFVTINAAELTTVYSQASFGDTPIQIRVKQPVTIDAPSLLSIDSEQQLRQVFGLAGNDSPTVNVFFVDQINECGGTSLHEAIGCGDEPGNNIAVESDFAAKKKRPGDRVSMGTILIAHELGHNLGLAHFIGMPNLMNPSLSSDFTLIRPYPHNPLDPPVPDQVGTILQSSLVQIDQLGRFIELAPFSVVPEPGAILFALLGAAFLLERMRRRTSF